jgi:hypothetical protein
MAIVIADRVKETTTTTGTGSITLAGASTGFQSFAAIGNGNSTYYTITDGTNWEVGLGSYSSTGPTLFRVSVLSSSNSNQLVDWGAGTKTVFVTVPSAAMTLTEPENIVVVSSVNSSAFVGTVDVPSVVEYLVVAGGGAGAAGSRGGAGGAGGVLQSSNFEVSVTTNYNVTVGGGGTIVGYNNTNGTDLRGTNGSNSVFASATAIGGGRGGGSDTYDPGDGGSGGGAWFLQSGGAGTAGQGNAGGSAGSSGVFGAGGGGGGVNDGTGKSPSAAGTGGTGGGGAGAINAPAGNATANTGSGGGGGANLGFNPSHVAGNGAAGILIARYEIAPSV